MRPLGASENRTGFKVGPDADRESGWALLTREIETYLGDTFYNVRRSVLGYARRIAGEAHAEDVVQETFLRLVKYCQGRDRALTWAFLFTITRNSARTLLAERRRAKAGLDEMCHERSERGEPTTCDFSDDDASSESSLSERISDEILALPERQRDALMLTEVHGLSEVQAAQVMHMSRAAVGARRRAALRRLRHVA